MSFRFGYRGCGTPTTDAPEGAFVMVLEDLDASGCRFTSPADDDILDVAASQWMNSPPCTPPIGPATAVAAHSVRNAAQTRRPRNGFRRAQFIVSAVDQFADDMPPVFRRLGELYGSRSLDIVALFNEGERTLIHGDTHSGNLFVDAGRTGFYDWAVAGRGRACATSRTSCAIRCRSKPAAEGEIDVIGAIPLSPRR